MKQTIQLLAVGLVILLMSFVLPVKASAGSLDKVIRYGLVVTSNKKTGDAVVMFKSPKQTKAILVVKDESGKAVLTQDVSLVAGQNKFNVDKFTSLSEGNYTLCLNLQGKIYTAPVLLWK